jgi:hypothetical protein
MVNRWQIRRLPPCAGRPQSPSANAVSCLWGAVRAMARTFSMPDTQHARRHRRRPSRRQPCGRPVASLAAYDRLTELPRILPLWPAELADDSAQGRQLILAKLRRALRAERRRGIAGHWTYDLARHVELLRIYRLELARCQTLSDSPSLTPGYGEQG